MHEMQTIVIRAPVRQSVCHVAPLGFGVQKRLNESKIEILFGVKTPEGPVNTVEVEEGAHLMQPLSNYFGLLFLSSPSLSSPFLPPPPIYIISPPIPLEVDPSIQIELIWERATKKRILLHFTVKIVSANYNFATNSQNLYAQKARKCRGHVVLMSPYPKSGGMSSRDSHPC